MLQSSDSVLHVLATCGPHFPKSRVGFYGVCNTCSAKCIRHWNGDPLGCVLVCFISVSVPFTQNPYHVWLKFAADGTMDRFNRFLQCEIEINASALLGGHFCCRISQEKGAVTTSGSCARDLVLKET